MTYNEKKRFLESYIYSIRKVKGLQNELEELLTISTGITQKLKPVMVQGGSNSNKIENGAIKMAELEDKIEQEIERAISRREDVERVISQIRDTRRREIVEMRYIHGMSVSRIAHEIEKEDTNVYKMLRKSIRSLDI